jgi:alpha-L-fucosidase 2
MKFKQFKNLVALSTFLLLAACGNQESKEEAKYRLWYKQPAQRWEETLPLGNGRIGIMPDGQPMNETLVLNDITLWSGGYQDADNPEAAQFLPEIQQLLFEGKNDEAQDLVYKTFVCKGAGSGQGDGSKVPYGSFETLGNLRLEYIYSSDSTPANYERELRLDDAIAHTEFEIDQIRFKREYFTSFTDDLALVRLTANQNGKISLNIKMDRPRQFQTRVENHVLIMEGQLNNGTDGNGMQYVAMLKPVLKGGNLSASDTLLMIREADEVILYLSMGTDFKTADHESHIRQILDKAISENYLTLKRSHITEYQSFFNRTELQLAENQEKQELPTDQRLIAFASDENDNGLVNLYFQYGRYLLISSAHARILPPNLQGLWANTVRTPWNGDYHLNINVQMNHWPAEITNLPELHKPLIDLTKSLVEPGQKTARVFYNANGWVAHMMTNIWGFTAPGEHPSWGATNTGGAWLAAHLWEHYDYNRDVDYLTEIYPALKGAAEFFLDMLVTDPNSGWLVTAPTTSPENAFFIPGTRKAVNICMGSTMDNQLVRELFLHTMTAASILKTDEEFASRLLKASEQLVPNRIGSDGRLMEWLEEYEEPEPQHRHVSHLYGLHPGNEITPELTPELAEAAKQTLYIRGDGGTGWSRAWKINFWARLHDGDHAFKLVKNLLEPVFDNSFNYSNKGGTYPNLFCAHPPFQIDGNFGGTAGIAEMFIQSHAGFINYIPALPKQFSEGSFNGLRVRGNGIASATWKNKQLTEATLFAVDTSSFIIKIPDYGMNPKYFINGKYQEISLNNQMLSIDLKKGDILEIRFI